MYIPLTKEANSLLQANTQYCLLWIKDLLHLLFTLIAFQIVLKTMLPMSLTDFSSGAAASPSALLVETHQMQKWKILTQSMKK